MKIQTVIIGNKTPEGSFTKRLLKESSKFELIEGKNKDYNKIELVIFTCKKDEVDNYSDGLKKYPHIKTVDLSGSNYSKLFEIILEKVLN
jgi:uncharacterized protein YlbG (UPF0298 family)